MDELGVCVMVLVVKCHDARLTHPIHNFLAYLQFALWVPATVRDCHSGQSNFPCQSMAMLNEESLTQQVRTKGRDTRFNRYKENLITSKALDSNR
jgi:hypothetical protein